MALREVERGRGAASDEPTEGKPAYRVNDAVDDNPEITGAPPATLKKKLLKERKNP